MDKYRPDGRGGRYLDRITIVGGAITPKPMNSAAVIIEGKFAASAPVVDWRADAQARAERNDPQRKAEDRMLAAADWPPKHWDRELRLSLIQGCAEAKAARQLEDGPERERNRARRDQANAYTTALAEWMAANR